ncbi:mitochondrial ribosomal death-associated protein 3-domain-containing protein [Obelidium mucronatum]|nr:mitochondrial ribosomal death-associated protein 3-domain-containing protein [Obelidium mucronatum]
MLRRALTTAASANATAASAPIIASAAANAAVAAAAASADVSSVQPVSDAVPAWTSKFALPDRCNSMFKLNSASFAIKNSSSNSSQSIAKSLASTTFFSNITDTVMLRESWLDLLNAINKQGQKDSTTVKIFLDSRSGNGKSTFLNLTATHFKSFGHIVLHFPNLSSWVSGLEPYAKSDDSPYFTQSTFASVVLSQILKVNSEVLDKITIQGKYKIGESEFKGSLSEFLAVGVEDSKHAHNVLNSFINELIEFPENRPLVLFSFDQVNALYCKTSYYDTESNAILPDQMALLRPFISLLARPSIPKAAVVCATDHTLTTIKSPFLNHILKQSPKVADVVEGATPIKITPNPEDLSAFSSFGNALVSKSIAPAIYDPITFKSGDGIHPVGVAVFTIPDLQVKEAYKLLEGLLSAGKLKVNSVSDDFVKKAVMITRGNPREILKFCV